MDTIQDFEDLLELFYRNKVKYLIIGGLAFIYHAKPRYTKDMDLWVRFDRRNVERANQALVEFGSPTLLTINDSTQILQIGVAPDRIDLIIDTSTNFDKAWEKRIESRYGQSHANWIDLDSLIEIKSKINSVRHQEDAHILKEVQKMKKK